MLPRRHFLQRSTLAIAASAGLFPLRAQTHLSASPHPVWHMPDEADPHTATWMAFGAGGEVWGIGCYAVRAKTSP